MFEIGRICIKTVGRDAMKHCVIIDIIDKNTVLIDGNTRRKNVNKLHIEPLGKVLKINKNETTEKVLEALEKEGIKITKNPNSKPKTNPKEQISKPKKNNKLNSKKKK